MKNEKNKKDVKENIIDEQNEREEILNEEEINSETSEEILDSTGEEAEELKKKLAEAEEKIANLENEKKLMQDSYLRKAAEFENYRRRTDAEQINLIKYAAEPFIIKILHVFDDFERSLNHIDEEKNREAIEKGLKLVYDKFKKVIEEQGVEKIKSKGEPFDFNYHEALMQKIAEDVPSHTVLEEIEPGYVYKDKVIKHAKVIVSQQPAADTEDSSQNSDENEKSE